MAVRFSIAPHAAKGGDLVPRVTAFSHYATRRYKKLFTFDRPARLIVAMFATLPAQRGFPDGRNSVKIILNL